MAAAERRGKTPPAELVAVAAMTERQLLERRARNGPARQRLSPLMQLVEADHSRRLAEGRARDAYQDKLDAEAVAAAARAEAEESSRSGRGGAGTASAQCSSRLPSETPNERRSEPAAAEAHERAMQQLRAELEQVRADAEADDRRCRASGLPQRRRAPNRGQLSALAATEAAEHVGAAAPRPSLPACAPTPTRKSPRRAGGLPVRRTGCPGGCGR